MDQVETWKRSVFARTNDTDHVQAAEVLAVLLNGEVSAEHTAKSITMIYEVSLKAKNGSTRPDDSINVSYFWTVHLFGAIRTFGNTATHQLLIDLLVEISRKPNVKSPDGSVKTFCDRWVYWKDLPDWEWNFANDGLYYSDAAQYPTSRKDDYLTQAPDLLNMTKFAATLLERGDFTSGLPMQASDCLSMGIEQDYDDKNDVNMKPLEWQVLLPTVSTWLIIAGKVIYDHCLNNEVEDPRADAETQTGWGGGTWTVQRWEFWKVQLGAFAERNDMDDECRGFAARAVQRMTEVESGRLG